MQQKILKDIVEENFHKIMEVQNKMFKEILSWYQYQGLPWLSYYPG